jgi:DNA replication protein DnaC
MATLLEGEVDKATKSQMSYTGFLERLVEEELVAKTDRSINQRIAKARFPALKTLEGFDFSFQTSLPVTLVKELTRLDFLGRGENVVAVGPPGTGKTHLLTALALKACEVRKRASFWCSQ